MREALLVVKGKKQGEIFLLSEKGQTIVGRGEKCEIQLNDPSISRRHFCITKQGEKFFLQDMGSSNGTLVNNKRTLWQELNIGDTIHCGAFQLQFLRISSGESIQIADPTILPVQKAHRATEIAIPKVLVAKPPDQSVTQEEQETPKVQPSIMRDTPALRDTPADIIYRKNRLEPPFASSKDMNRLSISLGALYKISELLHSPLELKQLAQELLQTVLSITKAQRACLLLKKDEDEGLQIIAYQTVDASQLSMLSISKTIVKLAIEKGISSVSSDAMYDQRFRHDEKASVVLHNIRSVICVPLEGKESILGALYVDSLITCYAFDHDDLELCTAIGRQAGLAVERTILQESISRSEQKYRTIFQKSPFAIILVNRTGRILDMNPAGIMDIAGGNAQTFIGETSILEIFQGARAPFQALLEQGEPFDLKEFSYRNMQDANVIVNIKGIPLFNEAGQADGAIIISEDITEAKKLQTQIIQQDKMATVGLLAAGVAHEFNNIVAGMMGFAQLMQMGKKSPDRLADVVVEQCSRAREIIERLLNFSRRKDIPREPVNLEVLLEDVFQLVERELMKNNIRVEKKFERVPKVVAHAGEMQQVFLNLVLNAVHAIGRDGTITVTLRREEQWVKIIFKDTGAGMPKEILSRVFEPFFTTKAQKGTGLGLSVSYTIIKSYNGEISVESELNKGATFTIQLPVTENLPAKSENASEVEETAQTTPLERNKVPENLAVQMEELRTILTRTKKPEGQK